MSASRAAQIRRGETKTITRHTKNGRDLRYELHVLQQPERARACGAGAKSSADRRPVDPPPVVELHIWDVTAGKPEEDITFAYSANFFLFATLEASRPIAHGRVQPAPSVLMPVLTGMPVSGMAYLDRPQEAGYFIFPDLSVRHEGQYKLSFNLYEQAKNDDDRDRDVSPNEMKANPPNVAGAPDESFDWRLEIKSNEFTVYSAKKFPGLAESTALSRTVAEQGCRVRIRRDVRMRRRETKGGDYDEQNEDDYRPGRPSQQEPYSGQPRSRSHSGTPTSDDGRAPYPDPHGEYPVSPYPYTASPTPSHTTGTGFQGNYLGNLGSSQQYQMPPQPPYAQPPAAPQSYPPPPPSNYQSGPSQFHAPPPPQSSYNNGYDRLPQSAFPSVPAREREREYENECRRASVGYAPAPAPQPQSQPQPPPPYPSADTGYPRSYMRPLSPPRLAPIKLPATGLKYDPKYEQPHDSVASPAGPLAPIRSFPPLPVPNNLERPGERPAPFSERLAPAYDDRSAYNQYSSGNESTRKRTYEQFNPTAEHLPLHNGMRPDALRSDVFNDDVNVKMDYKRADGYTRTRECPTTG